MKNELFSANIDRLYAVAAGKDNGWGLRVK